MTGLLRLRHKNYSQLIASLAHVKPDTEPISQGSQLHRIWKMINGSPRIKMLQWRDKGVDSFFQEDGISASLLDNRLCDFWSSEYILHSENFMRLLVEMWAT